MGIGATVREARDAAGISRDKLARLTGLTTRTIFRIENEESWSRGSIALIAGALELPFDELIHEVDGTPVPTGRGKTLGTRTTAVTGSAGPDSHNGD